MPETTADRIAFINDRFTKYAAAHPNGSQEIHDFHRRMMQVNPPRPRTYPTTDAARLAEAVARLNDYVATRPADAKNEVYTFHQRAKILSAELRLSTSTI